MFGHFTTLCLKGLTTIYHDLCSSSFIAVSLKFILHLKSEIPGCTRTTSQNRCKRERLITRVKAYARNCFSKKILSKNIIDSTKKDSNSEFWVQKFERIFFMNIWYKEGEQELLLNYAGKVCSIILLF